MINAGETPKAAHATAPLIAPLSCSLQGKSRTVYIRSGTRAHQAYGQNQSTEMFNCRYGLNPHYRELLFQRTLTVSGQDDQNEVRMVELQNHRWFIATLFLPQLASQPHRAHPLIQSLLQTALNFKRERRGRPKRI